MFKIDKELFNEPNCSINRNKDSKEKTKGCSRPIPGKASGGCAFDGAQIVLLPVADCAHIIHGPNLCCSHNYFTRGTRTSYDKPLYNYGFTTDLSELDIVFGAEDKLINKIVSVYNDYKPSAIFVYSTCVSSMIGEDLESACKKAKNIINTNVIPVDSPGFIGKKNFGNKIAGEALFKYVIGTGKPEYTTNRDICIIGEYNIAGEIWHILPLLKELNIRPLSKITGDATYKEITYAHYAKCSVVICSQALLSLARKLKTVYNIPFIESSFYSMRETKQTLLDIADMLDDKQLKKDILRLTNEKEKETLKKLMPYKSHFKGKKAFIYSGGVKSWSFVYLLEELGFEVVGTSIRKSTDEDIKRLEDYFSGKDKIIIGQESGSKILDIMKKHNIDILLAGGRNKYNSVKGKIPFIDINQEREHAYSGYEGIIRLAKDIYNEITCPVFKIARGEKKWAN